MKIIIGDKFEAFQVIQGDDKKRDEHQLKILAEYVKKHGITATMSQEYGQEAVKLKE